MKTKPTKKLPNGQVMWLHDSSASVTLKRDGFGIRQCVAVLPCHIRKTAQSIVRSVNAIGAERASQIMASPLWRMTEGGARLVMAKEVARIRSISPRGFTAMKPRQIVECCNVADAIVALLEGRK